MQSLNLQEFRYALDHVQARFGLKPKNLVKFILKPCVLTEQDSVVRI